MILSWIIFNMPVFDKEKYIDFFNEVIFKVINSKSTFI